VLRPSPACCLSIGLSVWLAVWLSAAAAATAAAAAAATTAAAAAAATTAFDASGAGPSSAQSSSAAALPWPTLYLAPPSAAGEATLCALWPQVLGMMGSNGAILRAHLPVYADPKPVAGLDGSPEYTVWVQLVDERVVAVLACPGKRKAADAPVAALLKGLTEGLCHARLAVGALRSQHAKALPWWSALLQALQGQG
jgi:hypothetical protein